MKKVNKKEFSELDNPQFYIRVMDFNELKNDAPLYIKTADIFDQSNGINKIGFKYKRLYEVSKYDFFDNEYTEKEQNERLNNGDDILSLPLEYESYYINEDQFIVLDLGVDIPVFLKDIIEALELLNKKHFEEINKQTINNNIDDVSEITILTTSEDE